MKTFFIVDKKINRQCPVCKVGGKYFLLSEVIIANDVRVHNLRLQCSYCKIELKAKILGHRVDSYEIDTSKNGLYVGDFDINNINLQAENLVEPKIGTKGELIYQILIPKIIVKVK